MLYSIEVIKKYYTDIFLYNVKPFYCSQIMYYHIRNRVVGFLCTGGTIFALNALDLIEAETS